ncbi:MAG: HK97 family phage prohead protease, partial [Terricaulis silvestris]
MKANKILARLAPQSWDDESQTVDAILSTGAGVKRRDTAGVYTEFLDIDASTVADLPPLLDSHRSQSLADLLGRVFDVRKENGKLIAKLHIDRPEIAARVRSGVIRDVSVGYTTTGVTERTDPKTRVRSKTARVHVIEASLVTIPADNGAQVRSNPMKKKQGADPALENDETPEGAVNDNATVETRAA